MSADKYRDCLVIKSVGFAAGTAAVYDLHLRQVCCQSNSFFHRSLETQTFFHIIFFNESVVFLVASN